MSAQLGETEAHKFLIGTDSVREPNEVHLIEFDEDESSILLLHTRKKALCFLRATKMVSGLCVCVCVSLCV
jgi:hypothetical protein